MEMIELKSIDPATWNANNYEISLLFECPYPLDPLVTALSSDSDCVVFFASAIRENEPEDGAVLLRKMKNSYMVAGLAPLLPFKEFYPPSQLE